MALVSTPTGVSVSVTTSCARDMAPFGTNTNKEMAKNRLKRTLFIRLDMVLSVCELVNLI